MVDDYFDLFKKVKNNKADFEKLSIKFKELRSLTINYKDDKELEIEKLKSQLNDFKMMVENILDKTTKSIEKFIENANSDMEKNIQ